MSNHGASVPDRALAEAEPVVSALRASIPSAAPGHWVTAEGREIAEEYASKAREELCQGALSDFELANAIYMVDRYDFSLLSYQTAAKERIRWLSTQLAIAMEARQGGDACGSVHDSAGPQGHRSTSIDTLLRDQGGVE